MALGAHTSSAVVALLLDTADLANCLLLGYPWWPDDTLDRGQFGKLVQIVKGIFDGVP